MNSIESNKEPHHKDLDDLTEKSIKKAIIKKFLKDQKNSNNDSASRNLPDEEEW